MTQMTQIFIISKLLRVPAHTHRYARGFRKRCHFRHLRHLRHSLHLQPSGSAWSASPRPSDARRYSRDTWKYGGTESKVWVPVYPRCLLFRLLVFHFFFYNKLQRFILNRNYQKLIRNFSCAKQSVVVNKLIDFPFGRRAKPSCDSCNSWF